MHVAYELQVANPSGAHEALELTQMDVLAQDSTVLASYKDRDLCAIAKPRCAEGTTRVAIPTGSRTVLLIWLSWTPKLRVSAICHSVAFKDAQGQQHLLRSATVPLAQKAAIEIGPPLGSDRFWLVTEGPGNVQSHHWGSLQMANGAVTVAQRFAIDFVGLNAEGRALSLKPEGLEASQNTDWFGYDAEVLAVADGVVRDARDGQPENHPFAAPAESKDLSPRGLYGNFVILQIAPGVFAHYAHLRPGSIRVRAGDRVRRGEIIARLGNSGNSEVPHLHFHVSNRPTFFGSEGMPFHIARFTFEGKAGRDIVLSQALKWSPSPSEKRDALPLDSDVVLFR